jgi:hypothetical protein
MSGVWMPSMPFSPLISCLWSCRASASSDSIWLTGSCACASCSPKTERCAEDQLSPVPSVCGLGSNVAISPEHFQYIELSIAMTSLEWLRTRPGSHRACQGHWRIRCRRGGDGHSTPLHSRGQEIAAHLLWRRDEENKSPTIEPSPVRPTPLRTLIPAHKGLSVELLNISWRGGSLGITLRWIFSETGLIHSGSVGQGYAQRLIGCTASLVACLMRDP